MKFKEGDLIYWKRDKSIVRKIHEVYEEGYVWYYPEAPYGEKIGGWDYNDFYTSKENLEYEFKLVK